MYSTVCSLLPLALQEFSLFPPSSKSLQTGLQFCCFLPLTELTLAVPQKFPNNVRYHRWDFWTLLPTLPLLPVLYLFLCRPTLTSFFAERLKATIQPTAALLFPSPTSIFSLKTDVEVLWPMGLPPQPSALPSTSALIWPLHCSQMWLLTAKSMSQLYLLSSLHIHLSIA